MFKKVIIVDDLGSINQGVLTILDTLEIKLVVPKQYCDDAYLAVKKAYQANEPFDLLITDLSFKTDHRDEKFKSGEDLIVKLQEEHPGLKIIVYSVEDRLQKIRRIIGNENVVGFVCKGRRGLIELSEAVIKASESKTYFSPSIALTLRQKSNFEILDYDIHLLKQLSLGHSQEFISSYFKEQHISPSSLSSVEKRLNKLRVQFNANNAIHLVSIVKDLGLI